MLSEKLPFSREEVRKHELGFRDFLLHHEKVERKKSGEVMWSLYTIYIKYLAWYIQKCIWYHRIFIPPSRHIHISSLSYPDPTLLSGSRALQVNRSNNIVLAAACVAPLASLSSASHAGSAI